MNRDLVITLIAALFGAFAIALILSGEDDSVDQNLTPIPTPPTSKVILMAQAFAQAEGFGGTEPDGITPNIPTQANNPGDLELGDIGYGQLQGKTIFPDVATGWSYLYHQCQLILDGTSSVYNQTMSFLEVAVKYTGNDNAASWAATVAQKLGITASTTVLQYAAL